MDSFRQKNIQAEKKKRDGCCRPDQSLFNQTSVYEITLLRCGIHLPIPVFSQIEVSVFPAIECSGYGVLKHIPDKPVPFCLVITISLETVPVGDIGHCLCENPLLRLYEPLRTFFLIHSRDLFYLVVLYVLCKGRNMLCGKVVDILDQFRGVDNLYVIRKTDDKPSDSEH